MLSALGSQSPRILARIVCREAGDLCLEEEIGEEELLVLVGMELAIMETYGLVSRELGLEAILECLGSDECLDQLVDTSREAATLYSEGKYFFTITLEELKRIAEYLRKHLDEHDGAPPSMRKQHGEALT